MRLTFDLAKYEWSDGVIMEKYLTLNDATNKWEVIFSIEVIVIYFYCLRTDI